MRLLVLTVRLLALPVCACGPVPDAGPDDPASALRALELETGQRWSVRWHGDLHTPRLLEGQTAPLISSPSASERAARTFLADHAALFRLGSVRDTLHAEQDEPDELGMAHVRFAQRLRGLPVWGHTLQVHFDDSGRLVRIEGRYAPLQPLAQLVPEISFDAARLAVLSSAAESGADPSTLAVRDTELGVDPGGDLPNGAAAPRLAFRIEVFSQSPTAPFRRAMFVDASTAEVYRSGELLDDLRGSGVGVFGDRREFEIALRSGRYYLEDNQVGSPPQRVYSASYGARLPGTLLSSDRFDRWDEAPVGAGAAVDAQANLELVESYFARVHGRRGALGKGDGMRATVHYGSAFANAFWNGRQLVFGDGVPGQVAPLSAGLDVVAHEYVHAISEATSNLGHEGETGALNEGISDVFACFVERAASGTGNWTIGEGVVLTGWPRTIRDLGNPHRTGSPAHVAEAIDIFDDRGGVHANSTIAAHAAFLMTMGGENSVSGLQVDGIGAANAERIWYRALLRYLWPRSDFRDAADATLTAARDLFGASSREHATVRRAWQAVGVLDP